MKKIFRFEAPKKALRNFGPDKSDGLFILSLPIFGMVEPTFNVHSRIIKEAMAD